jgi:hypothetical protein
MDEELWKEWPQDPRIKVSNKGNVVSYRRGFGYPLKVWRNSSGYLRVSAGAGRRPLQLVHKMVADTWIPNPNHYEQVNHINGDKDDNRVENLEWVTRSENMYHAYRTGLRKGTPIRIPETGEVFESQTECARRIGGDQRGISDCLRGRQSTHRGYHFEYVED